MNPRDVSIIKNLQAHLIQLRQRGQQVVPLSESLWKEFRKTYLDQGELDQGSEAAPLAARVDSSLSQDRSAHGPKPSSIKHEPSGTDKPKAQVLPKIAPQLKESQLGPLPQIRLPEGSKEDQWKALRESALSDPVCRAQLKRGKQLVFGVGNLDADIFFCGEAPGAEEEIQGKPFVGPAGQLLGKIIQAMGLTRERVYIANIMTFRPVLPTSYGNRPPTPDEMAYCLPYLKAQLDIVRPKVIVALGATAAKGLFGDMALKTPMRELRKDWYAFEDQASLKVTYHPSYLLHNNTLSAKRAVWEDMMRVMELLNMPISATQRAYFQQ